MYDPLKQSQDRHSCEMFAACVCATHHNLVKFQEDRKVDVWPPNRTYYAMPRGLELNLAKECRRMQNCIDWLLACFRELESMGCPVTSRLEKGVHELQRILGNLKNVMT